MGKVALLAEREDGAAQSSKQSQGLCTLPGHCWQDSQFAPRAMRLWDRNCGTHSKPCRNRGAKGREGAALLRAGSCSLAWLSQVLSAWKSLSPFSPWPLSTTSTEDPGERTCPALIVHLPVKFMEHIALVFALVGEHREGETGPWSPLISQACRCLAMAPELSNCAF